MKNILIIGSKGFIGTYLKQSLAQNENYTIYECDVVADYTSPNYFIADVSNTDYSEIFRLIEVDFCINCSGAAIVNDSLKNPLRDFMLNTSNVFYMLDAIRKYRPRCKYINLSSAAVYGNPTVLPIKEQDRCLPVSPYGKHKLYAEDICKEYYEFFGIQTCSVRIFSAYGPGLQKQILWDIFKKTTEVEGVVKLYGTGNETRDFIYIEDIVLAINEIIANGSFTASIYNLASGKETSIQTVANLLLQEIGYQGVVEFSGDLRDGDPINWLADISKMKAIGFIPNFSIEQGIQQYTKWLREKQFV